MRQFLRLHLRLSSPTCCGSVLHVSSVLDLTAGDGRRARMRMLVSESEYQTGSAFAQKEQRRRRAKRVSACLWRNNNGGAWCSRYPPHSYFSATWQLHGHRESALMALQAVWRHKLMIEGQTEADRILGTDRKYVDS